MVNYNYMFLKGSSDIVTDPANSALLAPLLNFATLYGGMSGGDTPDESREPVTYNYVRFNLADNIQSIPNISSYLKTVGTNISNVASANGAGGSNNMPNVIFSSLPYAPFELYSQEKDSSYLNHNKLWAENDVKTYGNEFHRHMGDDYHELSTCYHRIDLYNCFHQSAPVHVIGSDDGHAGIQDWNVS